MGKDLNTQWHPAFCSAVKLELIENKGDLDYTNEYNLNSKPIQMDLLVIKKSSDVEIKNEIGHIFRGHNIMEYKSPEASMNLDTFIKVIGYACLYKEKEEHIGDISLEDITISLIKEKYPRDLLKWFAKNKYLVTEKYNGIYYVEKEGSFPIQVIVSKKLTPENQKWLTLLSKNLKKKDAERIVLQMQDLTQNDEWEYAASVLEVALKENQQLLEYEKEDIEMVSDTLFEFFEPMLEKRVKKEVEKAVEEAVDDAVLRGREEMIRKAFENNLTAQQVADFFKISLEEVESVERKILAGE